MFEYRAFDLQISSALELPGFLPANADTDVHVRLEYSDNADLVSSPIWSHSVSRNEVQISHLRAGLTYVRNGSEIIVTTTPHTDPLLLPLCVSGPAVAYILWQRGMFVLHASAVLLDGRAVAFVGVSGEGKSSMAAAMHARGYAIVSDDVTAIDLTGTFTVHPGFPRLKLDPAVAQVLEIPAETLTVIHPHLTERGYFNATGFTHNPVPLSAIVVLEDGPAIHISKLTAQEALLELLRHCYAARHMRNHASAERFRQAGRLANAIPIYRLTRPRLLNMLPELAGLLEEMVCASSVHS